jgi:ABC-type Fe3+/spermidine/putrescine transport system ATPase subunit
MIPHCGSGEERKTITANHTKIRIEGATKSFLSGSVVAFENLTLDVRTEEIICILGPSGCGKTTLLKGIDGLYSLEGGRITIDGHGWTAPGPRSHGLPALRPVPLEKAPSERPYGLHVQKMTKAESRSGSITTSIWSA